MIKLNTAHCWPTIYTSYVSNSWSEIRQVSYSLLFLASAGSYFDIFLSDLVNSGEFRKLLFCFPIRLIRLLLPFKKVLISPSNLIAIGYQMLFLPNATGTVLSLWKYICWNTVVRCWVSCSLYAVVYIFFDLLLKKHEWLYIKK